VPQRCHAWRGPRHETSGNLALQIARALESLRCSSVPHQRENGQTAADYTYYQHHPQPPHKEVPRLRVNHPLRSRFSAFGAEILSEKSTVSITCARHAEPENTPSPPQCIKQARPTTADRTEVARLPGMRPRSTVVNRDARAATTGTDAARDGRSPQRTRSRRRIQGIAFADCTAGIGGQAFLRDQRQALASGNARATGPSCFGKTQTAFPRPDTLPRAVTPAWCVRHDAQAAAFRWRSQRGAVARQSSARPQRNRPGLQGVTLPQGRDAAAPARRALSKPRRCTPPRRHRFSTRGAAATSLPTVHLSAHALPRLPERPERTPEARPIPKADRQGRRRCFRKQQVAAGRIRTKVSVTAMPERRRGEICRILTGGPVRLLHGNRYLPRFLRIHCFNAVKDRAFRTCLASAQPRLAVCTPYSISSRSVVLWASVHIAIIAP